MPGVMQRRAVATGIALVAAVALAPPARPDPADATSSTNALVAAEPPPSPGADLVRALVAARRHPDLAWADFRDCAAAVERFYTACGWSTAWVKEGVPTPQARAVIAEVLAAERRGLDPEDYDGPRWAERLLSLGRAGPASPEEMARFDVAVTVVAARYASDLQVGRIGQHDVIRWRLGRAEVRPQLDAFLRSLSTAGDVEVALSTLEPPFAAYRRTLGALERYRQLAREHDLGPVSATRTTVAPGDRYAGTAQLARLLRALGDLPATDPEPRDGVYQGAIVEAVKRFQERHGLEPDGRLGAETQRQLSTPLSRRVRQLELTLERWRWVPRWLAPPLVAVNIPEFRLHAVDGRDRRLSMKVVVGKAYHWQTPVFAAEMTHVIFRPFWMVPRRMARVELAPRIERDASFLEEDGYDAVDGAGRVVPMPAPHELSARLRAGSLRLRQRPGPRNALGGVKFVFPNEHDVYLHATPARKLFARSRRDFSHGCIRVEDPVALASWVLEGRGWPVERIRAAMEGGETLLVPLPRRLPVLIVYGTATVGEDGEVRFFDDVYHHDAALERALLARAMARRIPTAAR